MVRKILLSCGVLSPILYAVADVVAGKQWEGYSFRDQTIGYQTWFIVFALALLRKPLAVRAEDGTKEGMSSRKKIALTIAAVMLFGATIIVLSYESEIRPIRAKVLAGGSIVETVLGKIEYAAVGAGTPLLSIHGAGGGYDQGLLIGTALVGNGFRVIAPSRFGYLRTPVPSDASPAAQADAHAALLDALGVDRAIVVGTSAGAPSATQLALRHPEKVEALILLAPQGYAPGHKVQLDATPGNRVVLKVVQAGSDFAYWSLLHGKPSVVIRFMGVPPEVLKEADLGDRQWATRMLTSIHPLSMRVAGIANDSSIRLDAWPLERIGAPTLIFSTSDDLFHTQPAAEYAAAHIPGAKLVVYPTGGHLFVGHSSDLRSAVAVFLEQSLPRFTTEVPADNVKSSAQK